MVVVDIELAILGRSSQADSAAPPLCSQHRLVLGTSSIEQLGVL